MPYDKELIIDIAKKVREFIDKECLSGDIPKICEWAVDAMSDALIELEIGHSVYYGLFNCNESDLHVWIEINDEVLDIIADQFGDYPKVWYPANKIHYQCYIDVEEILF